MGQPTRKCPTCGHVTKPLSLPELLREKIEIIRDWFETKGDGSFDISFVDSLSAQLEDNGQLTSKQIAALNNIIEKYGME